jgi:tetratricopeptide (TPR) repeat protein
MAAIRRVRAKRLLLLVAVLAGLAGVAFGVYKYQKNRTITALLAQARQLSEQARQLSDQADQLKKAGDNDQCKQKYTESKQKKAESKQKYAEYVAFRPNDVPALAEYVELTDSMVEDLKKELKENNQPVRINPRIFTELINLYERLLLKDPNLTDQRWKVSQLYFEMGNLANARNHLEALENSPYKDKPEHWKDKPEYWVRRAQIEKGEDHKDKAIEYYNEAIKLKTAEPQVHLDLAFLTAGDWSNTDDVNKAAKIIKDLTEKDTSVKAKKVNGEFSKWRFDHIQQNPNEPPEAFEARRAQYRDAARKDLESVLETEEAVDPSLYLWLADLASFDITTARKQKILSDGLQKFPDNATIRYEFARSLQPVTAETPAVRTQIRDELIHAAKDAHRQDPVLLDIVDLLIDRGESETAKSLLKRVQEEYKPRTEETDSPFLTYFQARLAMLDGDWPTALKLLPTAVESLEKLKGLGVRVWVTLATCQDMAGNPDGQLEAATKAVRYDPRNPAARFFTGDALIKLGRFAQAVETLNDRKEYEKNPKWRERLCNARFMAIVSQRDKEPNWEPLKGLLDLKPYSADLALTKAAMYVAKKDRSEAEKTLTDAIVQFPDNARLRLALYELNSGSGDAAAKVLNDAGAVLGDNPDLRIAKLGQELRDKPRSDSAAVEAAVEKATRGAEQFSPNGRGRLYRAVGLVLIQTGQVKRAIPYFEKACDARPHDLTAALTLFDATVAAKDAAATDRALTGLKKLEGTDDGPVYVVCQATWDLDQLTLMDDKKLLEKLTQLKSQVKANLDPDKLKTDSQKRAAILTMLQSQVEAARAKRESWPRVHQLLGDIHLRRGNKDDALVEYTKAIDLGERSPPLVLAAHALLLERGQFDRANQLLKSTRQATGITTDELERMIAVQSAVSNPRGTLDRFNTDSKNYKDHYARGHLLILDGKPDEAEKALRKALELSEGKAPEVWFGLIRLLAQEGKTKEAEKVFENAKKELERFKDTLPPTLVPMTLGLCREAMSDAAGAEKYYLEAAAGAPDTLPAPRQLSALYQRIGRYDDAKKLYEEMEKSNNLAVRRFGRRMLALSLTSQLDGYTNIPKAIEKLDENLKDANQVEDRRAKAYCIAVDPFRRDEAKQMIVDSVTSAFPLTPDDHVMLARIYLEDHQDQQALAQLTEAVRDPLPSIEHLAMLAKLQVRLGNTADAATTVDQMRRLAPASWETVSSAARVTAANGDKAAAANRLLGSPTAQLPGAIPRRVAPFLEELGCKTEAEKALEDDLKRTKSPQAHVPLAAFYIRTGQIDKAIALAKAHDTPDCPPATTAKLLSAAVYSRPRSTPIDEEWTKTVAEVTAIVAKKEKQVSEKLKLEKGEEKKKISEVLASILSAEAELADAAGNYDDAITKYDECLRLSPDGYLYLNNAAVLMALNKTGASGRPVEMADRVIRLRGPRAEFIDTRGLGYLADGDSVSTRKAIADFTLAAKLEPKAVYFFHLAEAQDQAESPLAAAAALADAVKMGLTRDTYKTLLHPLEWPSYETLTKIKK